MLLLVLFVTFLLAIDEIYLCAILHLDLVLADVLGQGIGGLLVGILQSLYSPASSRAGGRAVIDGHALADCAASNVLDSLCETALWNIQAFQAIGVIDAQVDFHQFIIDQDTLYRTFHTLLTETAHSAIETGAFGNRAFADVNVIKQTESHTAAVNGLNVFIDDGFDELMLRLIGGNGVEILVVFLVTFHYLLSFCLFGDFGHGMFIHHLFTLYFTVVGFLFPLGGF